MGGLLNALNSGQNSLLTNQKNLEVVGNNIANVNTEGYTRQQANIGQLPALEFQGFFVGQGVGVESISRDYNQFVTQQIQEKTIASGDEAGRSDILQELERIFEISDTNLAGKIDDFFDSWQVLSLTPGGTTERDNVLQAGQELGTAFNSLAEELDTLTGNVNDNLETKLEGINQELEQLAELNGTIQSFEISGQEANAARDQRDALIKSLATSIGVETYTDGSGMIAVQLPGGIPLVEGSTAFTLTTETTPPSTNPDLAVETLGGNTTVVDLDSLGGELKGMLDTRDTFIPELQEQLDTLALEITEAVNNLHSTGYGLDGSTGVNFFTDLGGVSTNASRNLSVALTDTDQVAAASLAGGADGDNGMALEISALETNYNLTGTNDTFDSYFSGIIATVGLEVHRNEVALEGNEEALLQLENLRENYSGVSLEEEMIDLIQYQSGFEASAQYITVIDEMMTTLLQLKA